MENIKKINKGYVLLETIFYISFFAILSITVINAMITITKSFKETVIQAELMQGGNIMERMSREIKQAYGVNTIGINNLKLNTTDDNDVNKTVEFLFSSPNVSFLENDIVMGNLNTQNITVMGLTFTQIDTPKGIAIKIFLTVKSNHDSLNRNQDFYNTVVLRDIY